MHKCRPNPDWSHLDKDDVGATLVVALCPAEVLGGFKIGADRGRPQGSPLPTGKAEDTNPIENKDN